MTSKQTQTDTSQAVVGEEVEEKPNRSLVNNLLSIDQWVRFAFMVLFMIVLSVVGYVIGLLVIVQFVFVLITGQDNQKLRNLGSSFSIYISQILQFLTYNSEDKPFPFADWPEAAESDKPEDNKEKDSSSQ